VSRAAGAHPAEPAAGRGPSPGYRRLALATAIATFALVIVGGVVRVSDSGLGCGPAGSGFHGWPFCNGDVVPGLNLNSVIEYSHRMLAGVVGIAILALAIGALRRYRSNKVLVRATIAAGALVVAQAVLGGATVEEDLNEGLVAAHLGLAMLLLGTLILVHRATRPEALRTTGGPTTSSATAPTTPAARSSPPATGASCRSARRDSWTST
jgi:heme A synthase